MDAASASSRVRRIAEIRRPIQHLCDVTTRLKVVLNKGLERRNSGSVHCAVAGWLGVQATVYYLLRKEAAENVERRGERITYPAYFQIGSSQSRIFITFFMIEGAKVADGDATWF